MAKYGRFADLIRRRRKEKEMTLDQVARAVGWSIPYLSELERGIKQPPMSKLELERLARILELDSVAVRTEAAESRRSVEIGLVGVSADLRTAAVKLAQRFESMSDEEAKELIRYVERMGGPEREFWDPTE